VVQHYNSATLVLLKWKVNDIITKKNRTLMSVKLSGYLHSKKKIQMCFHNNPNVGTTVLQFCVNKAAKVD
jgi:hypothetical protein